MSTAVKKRKASRRKTAWAYLFIAPQLVGLVLFSVAPTVASFVLSFTDFQLGSGSNWVGVDNYVTQFTNPVIIKSIGNTVLFTLIYVPALVVVALTIALLMVRVKRGRAAYQIAFFMPLVTSTAATALIWALVFQPAGIANQALGAFGLPPMKWLSSSAQALPTLAIIVVWASLATSTILFIAAVQSVPAEMHEAASLDGAGRWRMFWSITFPMISPTTFFIVVLSVIAGLQLFLEPYLITKGGPGNSTTTVVLELYRRAFEYSSIGPASAIAIVLFLAILVLTVIQFRLSRWVNYDR